MQSAVSKKAAQTQDKHCQKSEKQPLHQLSSAEMYTNGGLPCRASVRQMHQKACLHSHNWAHEFKTYLPWARFEHHKKQLADP